MKYFSFLNLDAFEFIAESSGARRVLRTVMFYLVLAAFLEVVLLGLLGKYGLGMVPGVIIFGSTALLLVVGGLVASHLVTVRERRKAPKK